VAGNGADGTGPGGMPDGIVDQFDYQFWKDNFGNVVDEGVGASSLGRTGNASITVPEPQSLGLVLLALLAASGVARRRAASRR
jgi:hypothetical protein